MCAAGMGTPRIDSLKFAKYTIIENAHIVCKKLLVFYVAVICTTTGEQNKYGLLCAVVINPPELPTNLETKHILQAHVCDDISTKNQTGNQWHVMKSAKPSTLNKKSFEIWLKSIKGP